MKISITNQKGGVGKTTLAFNLAYVLAQDNKKVLAVDTDFQGALTLHCQVKPRLNLYHALIKSRKIDNIICKTKYFDLLPGGIELSAAEIQLVNEIGREYRLKELLSQLDYDFIIIDTPPYLGQLTINALAASDKVLIPVETRFLGLRGLKILFDILERVKKRINPSLQVVGIIPTFYEERTIHSRDTLSVIKKKFPDIKIFKPIKKTVKFQDASVSGEPISKYTQEFIEIFEEIKKEILK